jgi:DnaJ-class molecular chaperone
LSKHHDILGVPSGCGTEILKARWRALAKIHHPDTNPSASVVDFTTFRRAYQEALKMEVAKEQNCPECSGTGKVQMGNGFTKMSFMCPTCKGVKREL